MANTREIALWAAIVILFILTVLLVTLDLWGIKIHGRHRDDRWVPE